MWITLRRNVYALGLLLVTGACGIDGTYSNAATPKGANGGANDLDGSTAATDPGNNPVATGPQDTWDNYAKGFFDKWCVACHAGYATQAAVQAGKAQIITHIEDNTMPKGAALSAAAKLRILDWLALTGTTSTGGTTGGTGGTSTGGTGGTSTGGTGGAGTTTGGTTGGRCTTDTYANFAQAFFTTKCTGCHPGLATYTSVASQAITIEQDVLKGVMPKGSVLTASEKSRIITWIGCGLPQ